MPHPITIDDVKLRRIALAAQGLTKRAPFGRGRGGALRAIEHLGYVQIDTISVVARAHHHVLHTRVPGYRTAHLDHLLRNRNVFEYWAHAAAFLPMRDYRYSLVRKRAVRTSESHWARPRDTKLMRRVLDRVRAEGPLGSRDFEDRRSRRAGWWDWKPAKRALEYLYLQGDLMVASRDGFQKRYEVTERVLPSCVDTTMPRPEELARHLIEEGLRAHGIAGFKSFAYGRRAAPTLKPVLRRQLDALAAAGTLVEVQDVRGGRWWTTAERLTAPAPRAGATVKILSPFDNSVIQRERAASLFDFDYQIECYVPEQNRRYGYFSLPLAWRDALVGRMDCKSHRGEGRFEIRNLVLESEATWLARDEAFLDAFSAATRDFAAFDGCTTLTVSRTYPARLRAALAARFVESC